MGKNVDRNNSTEIVLGDKIIIAGYTPNLNPSVRKDNVGRTTKRMAVTGSMGDVPIETAGVTLEQCDNGSDWPGGMINLVGMNGIKLEAGAAGITFATAGNINVIPGGGLCNIAATEGLSCVSKNVSIASTGATNITGGSLSVESQQSSFSNNVSMQGNAKISGGCFINGEAFIPHMTTQKQENYTEDSGPCSGYLNPNQTLILLPGDKSLIEASTGKPDALYVKLELDLNSLVAILTRLFDPKELAFTVKEEPTLPLYVKPILVHPLSQGLLNGMGAGIPNLRAVLIKEHPCLGSIFDVVDSEPDFIVFGHCHKYYGPACSYCDDTGELYKEAMAVDGNELVQHKPCEPNGGVSATKKMIQQRIKNVKDQVTSFIKGCVKSAFKSVAKP